MIPGSGRFPWRRERLPTPVFWPGEFHELYGPWGHKEVDTTERFSLNPVFLPEESHGWRSLVSYSPWGCKELDTSYKLNSNRDELRKCFYSQSAHCPPKEREKKMNQHLHKSVVLLQMLRRKYFFKSAAEKQKAQPTRVEKTRKKP